MIEHANHQRYSVDNQKVMNNTIAVTKEWEEELFKMPFVSKQKGRMSHLLKQKSKVGAVQKDRVKYDPLDFSKRKKGNNGQSLSPLNNGLKPPGFLS